MFYCAISFYLEFKLQKERKHSESHNYTHYCHTDTHTIVTQTHTIVTQTHTIVIDIIPQRLETWGNYTN